MKHKRSPISKKQRAERLASLVQERVGLTSCTPLLTQAQAAAAGYELPGNVVKFVCRYQEIETAVPIARIALSDPAIDDGYLVNLISRVWMHHLKTLLAGAVLQAEAGEPV